MRIFDRLSFDFPFFVLVIFLFFPFPQNIRIKSLESSLRKTLKEKNDLEEKAKLADKTPSYASMLMRAACGDEETKGDPTANIATFNNYADDSHQLVKQGQIQSSDYMRKDVYVGDVPAGATGFEIRSLFKKFGEIQAVHHNWGPYAFVVFASLEAARRALTASHIALHGVRLRVRQCTGAISHDSKSSNGEVSDGSAHHTKKWSADWFCSKCFERNFKWREACFACGVPTDSKQRSTSIESAASVGSFLKVEFALSPETKEKYENEITVFLRNRLGSVLEESGKEFLAIDNMGGWLSQFPTDKRSVVTAVGGFANFLRHQKSTFEVLENDSIFLSKTGDWSTVELSGTRKTNNQQLWIRLTSNARDKIAAKESRLKSSARPTATSG